MRSVLFCALLLMGLAAAMPHDIRTKGQDHHQVKVGSNAAIPSGSLNKNTVTISGISAGAAFAVQYHFAYSSQLRGAGIVAGLPYYCAQGNEGYAFMCMDNEMINLESLLIDATINADLGLIDPIANIANQTVWLWSGLLDTVVNHGAMQVVQTMYENVGVKNLVAIFNYTAEHAWVTSTYGNGCSYLGHPFINNCGYDFGGKFLASAFANMNQPWNPSKGTYNSNNMMHFDMTPFGANPLSNSLDYTAYIYVPAQCQGNSTSKFSTQCSLHVNFHGCKQYRTHFNEHTRYVSETELNEWGETNNIVIFYPQTVANDLLGNPSGCFDWWGYTNSSYATNKAAQMAVINAAVQSLLAQ